VRALRLSDVTACLTVLACLVLLKWLAGQGDSEKLAWLLYPTAEWVEALTGIPFEKEVGTGYVNLERQILIVPACAGVRFLAVSFSMCVFLGFVYLRSTRARWTWLCFSAAGAYLLTILTNAVRIVLSIYLHDIDIYGGDWLTPHRMHRVAGIATYLTSLCLLGWIASYFLRRFSGQALIRSRARYSIQPVWREDVLRLSTMLAPFIFYCGIVILLPLLSGAYQESGSQFVEHSFTVLGLCTVWLLFSAVIGLFRRGSHRKRRE